MRGTRAKREQDRLEHRGLLLAQAAELDAVNTLVEGRCYQVHNQHHLEHGQLVTLVLTPGNALRRAAESEAAWTIWSGWLPGQAIIRVGEGTTSRISWVDPGDLRPID